jgi:hypothetical protein
MRPGPAASPAGGATSSAPRSAAERRALRRRADARGSGPLVAEGGTPASGGPDDPRIGETKGGG